MHRLSQESAARHPTARKRTLPSDAWRIWSISGASAHRYSGRLLVAAIRNQTRIYRLGETRSWIRAAVVVNPVDRCCEI
jgi:hypothetical protein